MRSKFFIVGGLLALMPLACALRSEAPAAVQPPTVAARATAAGEPVAKTPLSTATAVAPTSTVVPTALATEIQLIMNTAAKRKQTLYSNTVFQSQDYEKFLPIKDKI